MVSNNRDKRAQSSVMSPTGTQLFSSGGVTASGNADVMARRPAHPLRAAARPRRLSEVASVEPPRIAVIGAGVAGSACVAGLLRAGFDVTVFDKSRGVGGRMATRRAKWVDSTGVATTAAFDHGCPHFTATRPRFQALIERAEKLGVVATWRQHVYAEFPSPRVRDVVVPTPDMPALCRHLLSGVPLRLGNAVTGLHRCADGWQLRFGHEEAQPSEHERIEEPFAQVVLAMPPAQAAMLLHGHHDDWAAALAAVRMASCWTLMASTDDLDWPWDVAEPEHDVLAWIGRSDRKPGRSGVCGASRPGTVQWVAHATPAWSLAHLDDDPAQVVETLRDALGRLLTSRAVPRWHHVTAHRWRSARLSEPSAAGLDCWWDRRSGLAVCGDAFGDGSVEAAWCSGDELADAVAASFDAEAGPQGTAGTRPLPLPEDTAEPVH
jgi:predicted NAD/FAD-dependent oxidoreductase